MTTQYGFQLLADTHISELNTRALRYQHQKTGAQLLSLIADDENKVFGAAFRTPPADSTGLPHILEHSVLGGSRKYPLKEPFVQLVKGSLNTYLNAFTSPDRTTYPVASTNLKDFYNLVDVYLDAVFHPLITPHHLDQEGWHYELDAPGAPLNFKGVVFNEMKGAYSSPDQLLWRLSKESLFPDTIYRNDSGGDPRVMPNLTYQQFKEFHETYYHPANAVLFFYGDDDPNDRLRRLDAVLSEFEPRTVNAEVGIQPHFAAPRRAIHPYGVDSNGDHSRKTMIRLNWLLPVSGDPILEMGLEILSYAIIGTQASPLRKTLIDSGLGEDVSGGFGGGMRQMTFAAGMKNIARTDADKVEQLILQTLQKLADEGIEAEMVEASVNYIEFHMRENNSGSTPRGLMYMMQGLSNWLYGGDPLDGIRYEAPLAAVKQQIASNPDYFQALIRSHLLENTHRTTLILEPDPELNQRLEREERARLDAAQAKMSEDDLAAIIANTKELKRRQAEQDTPELLAKLPRLTLGDLETTVKMIPIDVSQLKSAKLIYHDLFTNGIAYLNLAWNLQSMPAHLLPYVSLFGMSLTEMGTEKDDYVKLSQRIMRKTGGVSYSTFVAPRLNQPEGVAWFLLNGKATVDNADEMLDIMRDVLLTVKFDNPERFRQIVLKTKARNESGLVPSGSAVVDGRLRAAFATASWASEQMGGISYLFFLRQLLTQIDNDWPSVLANLEAVRSHLLNRNAMLCNVTLDAGNMDRFQGQLGGFLSSVPKHELNTQSWQPDAFPAHEGLTIPAQVNYVGKGANIYELGYQYHGSIHPITNFLRTGYLWEKIRVQGGAYGAQIGFGKHSGVLSFRSYRDPNLLATLDVYDQAANFLQHAEISDDELTRNIIGAISDLDGYQLPDAKGYTSFSRYLMGETDESRQRTRDEVLGAKASHFRDFAEVLVAMRDTGRVVVLGSAEAVEKANGERNGWLAVTKVM